MGSNAEERLLKRKINELEQELARLKRELDEAKSLKRQIGRLRKQNKKAVQQQVELEEVLEDENENWSQPKQDVVKEKDSGKPPNQPLRCKKPECKSDKVKTVAAGVRTIVVCEKCGAKYSFVNGN